jgi:hypothetical protein
MSQREVGRFFVTIENQVHVAGGELRWMQFVNRGIYDLDGQLIETQVVGRDITTLKQAEAALRESGATLERAQAVARIGSLQSGQNHIKLCGVILIQKNERRKSHPSPPKMEGALLYRHAEA